MWDRISYHVTREFVSYIGAGGATVHSQSHERARVQHSHPTVVSAGSCVGGF